MRSALGDLHSGGNPVSALSRPNAPHRWPGMVSPGNIDMTTRPRVKNPDGSISTVRSMSIGVGGSEILIPTVSDDGRVMSDDEAVENFYKTGRYLGVFKNPAAATAYAKWLHDQEARKLER